MKKLYSRRLEIFLEFLLFGLAIGIIEDLIAIALVSDEPITWHVIGIAAAVAFPFAVLGEFIVDRQHLIPVRKSQPKSNRKTR